MTAWHWFCVICQQAAMSLTLHFPWLLFTVLFYLYLVHFVFYWIGKTERVKACTYFIEALKNMIYSILTKFWYIFHHYCLLEPNLHDFQGFFGVAIFILKCHFLLYACVSASNDEETSWLIWIGSKGMLPRWAVVYECESCPNSENNWLYCISVFSFSCSFLMARPLIIEIFEVFISMIIALFYRFSGGGSEAVIA